MKNKKLMMMVMKISSNIGNASSLSAALGGIDPGIGITSTANFMPKLQWLPTSHIKYLRPGRSNTG